MGDSDLRLRTKEYALGISRLFSELLKAPDPGKAIVPIGHVSRGAIPGGDAG